MYFRWLRLSVKQFRIMNSEHIRKMFTIPRYPMAHPYRGTYNSLITGLFMVEDISFMVTFDKKTESLTVVVNTSPLSCDVDEWKPVFICQMLEEKDFNSPAVATRMVTVLKGLDTPLGQAHGVCVSGSRAIFYQYDRTKDVVVTSRQEMDIATENGALHLLDVAERVKSACEELRGKKFEDPKFD
jgi:hypothetical protein